MFNLEDTALEWSMHHVQKFYDSDFYPRIFEFDAIQNYWIEVKKYLLQIDLEDYAPKSPIIDLSMKANGTFRIVHRLDPIDSIIYTALIYMICNDIEEYRIPLDKNIACSYRIKTTVDGSFFNTSDNGWLNFRKKTTELTEKFVNGYVLVGDITDFYNQIYLHRIKNIIVEAGGEEKQKIAKVIETFLIGLNTKISIGIPVGPAPSIILAEAIMADIDIKIIKNTENYTRYVDDINIFFDNYFEAFTLLNELTKYLYNTHRLVLSGEKTKIMLVSDFKKIFLEDETQKEKNTIREKLDDLSNQYETLEEYKDVQDINELDDDKKFEILSNSYYELFERTLEYEKIDVGLLRHILRKALKYRIRNLIPLIFVNFNKLIPVIREVILYLRGTVNKEIVLEYKDDFVNLLNNKLLKMPFINMWVYALFQDDVFNEINIPVNYNEIIDFRQKALIAIRKKDRTFVKDYKNGLDTFSSWDRRALLFASKILSRDEMNNWISIVEKKDDILDKAISSLLRNRA